jgi:hypothetical protein
LNRDVARVDEASMKRARKIFFVTRASRVDFGLAIDDAPE